MPNNLLLAAAAYAARGWPVIPLVGKLPRTPHGYKDGSTDVDMVQSWWGMWPDSWIGLVCGPQSGLCVLDVDPRNGGDRSLEALVLSNGPLPTTLKSLTAGGGEHYYLAYEDGLERCELAPGLELKPHGGYVVAPPSTRPDGACYSWATDEHAAVASVPEWLARLARMRQVRERAQGLPDAIPAGSRNATLASLAGSMRHRGFSEAAILAALHKENERCDPPLPDREVETISRSIARYSPAPPVTAVPENGGFHLTDLGNARRFIAAFGKDVRYCTDRKTWLLWDGVHWRSDDTHEVERLAHRTILGIYDEIRGAKDEKHAKEIAGHARRSESDRAIRSALSLARSQPEVAIASKQLDADPWLLNCRNCVVRLSTGEILPHDRELLLSKLCPIDFDPGARHEFWDRFLGRVLPDREVRDFAQLAAGYSLTGQNSEEVLFFIHGPGASGKSSFSDAMRAVLGDYAATADFESFLKKNGDGGVRNDIARLNGSRMVFSLEMDEGKQLASGLVKRVTGGDHLTARFLYQELFEFRAAFKLWFVVNDRPHVSADDTALWRRVLVLPFDQPIPEADRDPEVKQRLREDHDVLGSILAWAVKGAYAWRALGKLPIPDRVRTERDAFRSENDVLGEFIDDRCSIEEHAYIESDRLYTEFKQWQERGGIKRPWSKNLFGARLRQRGFVPSRTNRVRCWNGISIQ